MTLSDWPSLAGQIDLASRLCGEGGEACVARWLAVQRDRVDDPAFAQLFSDHIDLPGIASGDYNHRLVRTPRGVLLWSIRLYAQDLARPFVEMVAHTFEESTDGIAALVDAVASEWSAFTPLHLRLLLAPRAWDALARFRPDAALDMSVHVALHVEMECPDGRLTLVPFEDVDKAIALVAERYADVAAHDPDLARNIARPIPTTCAPGTRRDRCGPSRRRARSSAFSPWRRNGSREARCTRRWSPPPMLVAATPHRRRRLGPRTRTTQAAS